VYLHLSFYNVYLVCGLYRYVYKPHFGKPDFTQPVLSDAEMLCASIRLPNIFLFHSNEQLTLVVPYSLLQPHIHLPAQTTINLVSVYASDFHKLL